MSFDWNLSSDEENGFDDWANVDFDATLKSAIANAGSDDDDDDDDEWGDDGGGKSREFATVAFPAENNDVDEEEEEDIDWEDAGDDDDDNDNPNTKLATDTPTVAQLKPVTLNMNEPENNKKQKKETSKRTKKAKRKYRYEHLPADLQSFLMQLERSHLLSCTGHALFASKYCSDDVVLNVSHSLIPLAWNMHPLDPPSSVPAPTLRDLCNFCNFFFELVNQRRRNARLGNRRGNGRGNGRGRGRRRQRTNTNHKELPPNGTLKYRTLGYCRHLAQQNDTNEIFDPGSFGTYDKVHLLISMARSLGWRARYVTAVESINRDLDVNHPLFVATTTRNVFQRLWREKRSRTDDGGGKRPAKKRARTKEQTDEKPKSIESPATNLNFFSGDAATSSSMPPPVCWVEILCRWNSAEPKTENCRNNKQQKMRWIHVDPHLEEIESQGIVESLLYAQRQGLSPTQESKKRFPISYALAAEHVPVSGGLRARVTDVTPRYAFSWTDSLKQRGVLRGKQTKLNDSERADIWLSVTLKSINGGDRKKMEELRSKGKHVEDAIVLDDDDDDADANGGNNTTTSADQQQMEDIHNNEMDELKASAKDEPMPTSKTAFKSHPIYVIPSVMNTNEVLVPDAKKRVCGVFKGELVFRRVDVETALAAKRWLYKGRKVKRDELRKPVLRVKARKKPASSGFKALKSYGVGASNDGSAEAQEKQIAAASRPLDDDNNDGMEDLYASWQTDPWSPAPVGPGDRIPVSRHNNIELELLNPGLVHIDEERIAVVAKQLGIPYAPCLLGFEGHAGNRTPTIRGIVVHEHNAELLREAHMEMASQRLEQSHENHQMAVYKKWKRLLIGVLTKDRLERAYGDDDE